MTLVYKERAQMPLPNVAELKRLKEEVEKSRPKPTHVEPGLYLRPLRKRGREEKQKVRFIYDLSRISVGSGTR